MTLPASGTISIIDIQTELGIALTSQSSLNDAAFRSLAGVPSGTIAFSDFYGKSAWSWSRPSANTPVGAGNTSNLSFAYDTSSATVDNSTCAVMTQNIPGIYPHTLTVTYNGFGSGTHTGHLYIAASGSIQDTELGATATIDIKVNGSSISGFPKTSTGATPLTFSYLSGSALSVALTGQDLSTLSIDVVTTGGHVGPLGDGNNAQCTISVYDLVFKP